MSDPVDRATLTFRCPRELDGRIPPPIPASLGLATWFKTMPQEATSALAGGEDDTVKRCPPFVDAMTCGFLMPLVCDLRVENGEFTWDNDLPPGEGFARSPIGFHDSAQVAGTPLFEADRFLIKFHNLWTIETPPGYSLLFVHPVNRFDLPFTTLSGLVDCDLWHDVFINFPAHWRDLDFTGVLPRGTPVAQCIPVRRDAWTAQLQTFTPQEALRASEATDAVRREKGVYRRRSRR
jgi:hypothetical protein